MVGPVVPPNVVDDDLAATGVSAVHKQDDRTSGAGQREPGGDGVGALLAGRGLQEVDFKHGRPLAETRAAFLPDTLPASGSGGPRVDRAAASALLRRGRSSSGTR